MYHSKISMESPAQAIEIRLETDIWNQSKNIHWDEKSGIHMWT